MPGSLPAREGGRGGGVLVSIGPKTSLVDVYGGTRRRIPNELLHPDAGPHLAAERRSRRLLTVTASGRGWLPGWAWLGWTIAEHVEFQQGARHLPTPPPAPQRLIIVACGARKANCVEAPAGELYTGSYHRAARRAADAITVPGDRVMILSAFYGLVDLADRIVRYDLRLRSRWVINAQGLREQAEQRGVLGGHGVVLAPAAYANLAAQVWPHAQLVLAGTRGIGDQMARFAALATGRATLTDLVAAEPNPAASETVPAQDQHAVSVRGGLVHLATTGAGPATAPAPACGVAARGGCRWRPSSAEVTCTRCMAILLRRRALHRWCAMVNRLASTAGNRSAYTPRAMPAPIDAPRPGRTGPARRSPTRRRSESRYRAGRRPGDTRRQHDASRWHHVPARPSAASPLTRTVEATPHRRTGGRGRYPRGPRPSIGRAPPPPRGARRQPHQTLDRPCLGRGPQPSPSTPITPLTRGNGATPSGSINGLAAPSLCTTRRTAGGHPLPEPLRPAPTPRPAQARTTGPTHAAPEDHPMTDLTTRHTDHGTPGPAHSPTREPVNGAAYGDRRSLRHASRAEQERLSADADVERRARAARLELELSEQRRAAARRERRGDQQERQARVDRRRARRAARHARLRAAAPGWADRALFILPILFPMAVAWVGQIRFAMDVMHWPLPAAIVFAAGFELSTAYAARLDWLARAAGDSALLFRGATWAFAAGAATMNYWHAAGLDFAPTGEAVSYGLMSITGVVLWELLSTYRHRTALRAEGKLPAARPRYGLARWIWFRPLTRLASLLALRDGYPTTDLAWQAALTAVDLYGTARNARKAIRAGRPVPRPEPRDAETPDNDGLHQRDTTTPDDELRDRPAGHPDLTITRRYLDRDTPARDTDRDGERDIRPRRADRDVTGHRAERDTDASDHQGDSIAEGTAPARETTGENETTADRGEPQEQDAPAAEDHEPTVADGLARDDDEEEMAATGDHDRNDEPPTSSVALIARMKTYARERAAQGHTLTGADLDRHFGTRDYGRKVLRQLATDTTQPT